MARNQYYTFAYQDIQFIVLDSQVFFGAGGREEQEAWLADRLADPATGPPFLSSTSHPLAAAPYMWVKICL